MDFIKRNLIIFLILVLALFLRFNVDTLIQGCNFDEFAIVAIAKNSFFEMIKAIAKEDYHAPLYYFLAHLFMAFKNNFLILRLINIIFSICNVYVFYKIARLVADKKTGYFLALFLTVNHLHISIANFIKFYALAILLTSISLYYFIKILKNNDSALNKLAIVNNFLILCHTFGFVFVAIEYLILKFNNKEIKELFIKTLPSVIFFLPILLFQTKIALFESVISPHGGYPALSFFALYNFLNDYFSPLISYACNVEKIEAPSLFIDVLFNYKNSGVFDSVSFVSFLFLSFIPVLVGVFGILTGLKNKIARNVFYVSILYLFFFLILVILNVSGLIPLYVFPSGFILCVIAVVSILNLKHNIKYFLVLLLLIPQLVIVNVFPVDKREFPYKNYANIDEYINLIDPNIHIILIEAGRFAKYYYSDKNIVDFDYEEQKGSHSRKWLSLAFDENEIKNVNKNNLKEVIKPYILGQKNNENFENYLNKALFSKIRKNDKLILVFNSGGYQMTLKDNEMQEKIEYAYIPSLPDSSIKAQLIQDDKVLHQNSIGEIIQSYITKKIVNSIEDNFKLIKIEQFRPVPLKKFKKYTQKNHPNISTIKLMESTLDGWIFVTYQKE